MPGTALLSEHQTILGMARLTAGLKNVIELRGRRQLYGLKSEALGETRGG